MNHLLSKYLVHTVKKVVKKAPKVNIKPVDIDFPLPEKVEGSENRLNIPNTFQIP